MARFVLERINKEDGIEKYRQPGMVAICEDLVFICNHDLKFQYANLEDEIDERGTNYDKKEIY